MEKHMSEPGDTISRTEVINRAKRWIDAGGYEYSQDQSKAKPDGDGHTYRPDCSGYVSMAWHLPKMPGGWDRNTVSIAELVQSIGKDDLRPGDAIGNIGPGTGGNAGHILLFAGWANDARTEYHAYEQRGHTKTQARKIRYPYSSEPTRYKPYRYRKIREAPAQTKARIFGGYGGVLYGIRPDGHLLWYRHLDELEGGPNWAQAHGLQIGSGWNGFTTVVAGDEGVLYAVLPNGDLMWYRHLGQADGEARFAKETGVVIGSGWNSFTAIVASNQGVLYGVLPNGDLMWHRHLSPSQGVNEWANPRGVKIGDGWNGFTQLVAANDGVLYGVLPNGDLIWYRQLDPERGDASWAKDHGTKIGSGWNNFTKIVSNRDGILYAALPNGDLMWYRQLDPKDGSAKWAKDQGVRIAVGWNMFDG